MFYRLIRGGYAIVYEPRCLVFHQHRRDYRALRNQYRSWGLGLMAFLGKCRQTDAGERANLRRTAAWWFGHQALELGKSMLGQSPLPMDLVLAEMWGGILGLFGGYTRSKKRTERIRELFSGGREVSA
jgi:hypothetical protein